MPEEAYSLQKRQNNLYQESRPKESKNKKIAMTARLCNKCIRAGAVITNPYIIYNHAVLPEQRSSMGSHARGAPNSRRHDILGYI